MAEKNMDYNERFAYAFLKIRLLSRFYSGILSALPKVIAENIETIGVSDSHIEFAPKFIEGLDLAELNFIMLHETAHYALLHPVRRGTRDPIIYNIACDLYVNKLLSQQYGLKPGKSTIVKSVKLSFPEKCLYDDKVDVDVDTVESLYEDLIKKLESQGGKIYRIGGNGSKRDVTDEIKERMIDKLCGRNMDPNKTSDPNAQDKMRRCIVEAVTKIKLAGIEPGLLERKAEEAIASKIDWRKLVNKYLVEETMRESSFRTTDRRMLYQKAIFPGQEGYSKSKLTRMKIGIDTSASISDKDLGRFYAQIEQLTHKFNVSAEILFWDTEIESSQELSKINSFRDFKPKGGGGTTANCLFEYFDSKKCKIKPAFTVIFTDGYVNISSNNLGWVRKYKNTIWILTEDGDRAFAPPFGKVVQYDRYD